MMSNIVPTEFPNSKHGLMDVDHLDYSSIPLILYVERLYKLEKFKELKNLAVEIRYAISGVKKPQNVAQNLNLTESDIVAFVSNSQSNTIRNMVLCWLESLEDPTEWHSDAGVFDNVLNKFPILSSFLILSNHLVLYNVSKSGSNKANISHRMNQELFTLGERLESEECSFANLFLQICILKQRCILKLNSFKLIDNPTTRDTPIEWIELRSLLTMAIGKSIILARLYNLSSNSNQNQISASDTSLDQDIVAKSVKEIGDRALPNRLDFTFDQKHSTEFLECLIMMEDMENTLPAYVSAYHRHFSNNNEGTWTIFKLFELQLSIVQLYCLILAVSSNDNELEQMVKYCKVLQDSIRSQFCICFGDAGHSKLQESIPTFDVFLEVILYAECISYYKSEDTHEFLKNYKLIQERKLQSERKHLYTDFDEMLDLSAAQVYLDCNQFKESKQILLNILNTSSKKAEIFNLLGLVAIGLQHSEDALSYFQASYRVSPSFFTPLYNIAKVHHLMGSYSAELELLNHIIKIIPSSLPNSSSYVPGNMKCLNNDFLEENRYQFLRSQESITARLVKWHMINAFEKLGNHHAVVSLCEEISSLPTSASQNQENADDSTIYPSASQVSRRLAIAYMGLSLYNESLAVLEREIFEHPYSIPSRMLLAETYIRRKELGKCAIQLDYCLELIKTSKENYESFLSLPSKSSLYRSVGFMESFEFRGKTVDRTPETQMLFSESKRHLIMIDVLVALASVIQCFKEYDKALELLKTAAEMVKLKYDSESMDTFPTSTSATNSGILNKGNSNTSQYGLEKASNDKRRLAVFYNYCLLLLVTKKYHSACSEWIQYVYRMDLTTVSKSELAKLLKSSELGLPPRQASDCNIIVLNGSIPKWNLHQLDLYIIRMSLSLTAGQRL